MQKIGGKAVLFALGLMLTATTFLGCASHRQDSSAPLSAALTPTVRYVLPSLAGVQPFAWQQLLTAHYQEKSHQLVVQLEYDGKVLHLAGMTPFGLRLFAAWYDGTQLNIEKLELPAGQLPDAAQVLSDILLSIVPQENLATQLPSGFTLTSKGLTRILLDAEHEPVLQIDYKAQGDAILPVKISHRRFNYTIGLDYLN
ncbi:MAG: DUF3261 domain-containing protein [Candidatus Anaerobiospirillum merdipullorum]|uniref:DUF3261 domain-containing protein n=1 Tax=Candidatus Anaerobiospirillum merdipullorum TaxID=2838450 RepID=A0A9E2KN44_9GAMM|nr:DUF3261 domain-containing protein [Candidatus Anaerobiospirillum merdipullorum]